VVPDPARRIAARYDVFNLPFYACTDSAGRVRVAGIVNTRAELEEALDLIGANGKPAGRVGTAASSPSEVAQ
jgi:hypothetical protein